MGTAPLLLVCEQEDAAEARGLLEAVLRTWSTAEPPAWETRTPEQMEASDGSAEPGGAVWVFAGAASEPARLYRVLDLLEQRTTPALLSRTDETQAAGSSFRDGVLIAPPDEAPDRLRLLLQSTLSQGRMVSQVKNELRLAHRHRHGLAGQIDQLDEELRLAARVQRQFLPQKLPSLNGISSRVLFRPAGYVSGDTFDVKRLDEDHIGFYVADVVGHGVPAALLTMFIKQALQSRVVHGHNYRIVPPDEALEQLNRSLLTRQSDSVQFVTACYATLNCTTREMKIARAGHPAPLLLRADGRTTPLEPEGRLLGIFEDEKFDLLRVQLEPDDRLLVYSDGFEVAFGNSDSPASTEYVDELHDLRRGRPEEAMDRLERRLDQQSGSLHQRDDLTCLMLHVGEPANSARASVAAASTPAAAAQHTGA